MTDVGALLLCAGKGTRLLPLTDILPKCLMPINGRPLLEYWLRDLSEVGFRRVLVNLHHHADQVARFIAGSPFGRSVTTVHEPQLLGTAGTLLANRQFFGNRPVLLAHGDNLTKCDFSAMLATHRGRPKGCEITMMTFESQDPSSCGIVQTTSEGVVTSFHEKAATPPGRTANAAVYVIEPTVIDYLAGLGKAVIDFSTEVIPAYLNRIVVYHNATYHRDIGTLESLLMAQFDYGFAGIFGNEGRQRDEFLDVLERAIRARDADRRLARRPGEAD